MEFHMKPAHTKNGMAGPNCHAIEEQVVDCYVV